jgi:hypothetical protein
VNTLEIIVTTLVTGDCGAWVIDADTSVLYGHIVAGHADGRIAYIIPAHKILEDIKKHIGHVDFVQEYVNSNELPGNTESTPRLEIEKGLGGEEKTRSDLKFQIAESASETQDTDIPLSSLSVSNKAPSSATSVTDIENPLPEEQPTASREARSKSGVPLNLNRMKDIASQMFAKRDSRFSKGKRFTMDSSTRSASKAPVPLTIDEAVMGASTEHIIVGVDIGYTCTGRHTHPATCYQILTQVTTRHRSRDLLPRQNAQRIHHTYPYSKMALQRHCWNQGYKQGTYARQLQSWRFSCPFVGICLPSSGGSGPYYDCLWPVQVFIG